MLKYDHAHIFSFSEIMIWFPIKYFSEIFHSFFFHFNNLALGVKKNFLQPDSRSIHTTKFKE